MRRDQKLVVISIGLPFAFVVLLYVLMRWASMQLAAQVTGDPVLVRFSAAQIDSVLLYGGGAGGIATPIAGLVLANTASNAARREGHSTALSFFAMLVNVIALGLALVVIAILASLVQTGGR